MSSRDENDNPQRNNNNHNNQSLDNPITPQGYKSETKPLSPSNEESQTPKKKGSKSNYWQKKLETQFKKSGMRKDALLKYFVKKDPPPPPESLCTPRSSSVDSQNITPQMAPTAPISPPGVPQTISSATGANQESDPLSLSQESVIYLGSVTPACSSKTPPSSSGAVSYNDLNDSPRGSLEDLEPIDENQDLETYSEQGDSILRHCQNEGNVDEEIEGNMGIPNNDALNLSDRMEMWDQVNIRRRRIEEHEQNPPPSKSSRIEYVSQNDVEWDLSQSQATPELDSTEPSTSTSSSPAVPWKIVSVRGGVDIEETDNVQLDPSISEATTTTLPILNKSVRNLVASFKEKDNAVVGDMIKKKKWIKAVSEMKKDLDIYRLPNQLFVSEIVKQAVLCENSRVSKEVQKECMEFLLLLITKYSTLVPGSKEIESLTLIKYYKGIFEKVFDDAGERPQLNHFFEKIANRVMSEKKSKSKTNTLWLLNFVTRLVVLQYEGYEQQTQKVKPPLFQYFLESEIGNFKFNCCKFVISNLFVSSTNEEFCIYLQWLDLLVKRLKFNMYKTEYSLLIDEVAANCEVRGDYGLLIYLNSKNPEFSKEVCWKVLNKILTVTRTDNKLEIICEDELLTYMENLAQTLLIEPARSVLENPKASTCTFENLTLYRPAFDSYADDLKEHLDRNDRKRNRYGETGLHNLCKREVDAKELEKYLKTSPKDINAQDNFGNSTLHDCCNNDKHEFLSALIRLYLGKKITEPVDFLIRNKSLETPMHLASCNASVETVDNLKKFANCCGMKEKILLAPNAEGKLPFELASNQKIRQMLKPDRYDEDEMILFNGLTLSEDSKNKLINNGSCSFAIKKILAWWYDTPF